MSQHVYHYPMKLLINLQLLLITLLLGAGCADDGAQGPAGPAGPVGPAGPTGATGSPNVIYGSWFTPGTYDATTIFSIKTFTHTEEVPEITEEILNTGVVLVYAKLNGYTTTIWPTDQVGLLPITLTYVDGSTVWDTWSATTSVGELKIAFVNSGNIYGSISNQHQFRYVIIPGGVAASGGRVAGQLNGDDLARLRTMPYAEAMAFLGIPD